MIKRLHLVTVLILFSSLAHCLYFGALVFNTFVIVPVWSESGVDSLAAWSQNPLRSKVAGFIWAIAVASIASAVLVWVVGWKKPSKRWSWLTTTVACDVSLSLIMLALSSYDEFFASAVNLSATDIEKTMARWSFWNGLRILIAAVGFLSTILAINSPASESPTVADPSIQKHQVSARRLIVATSIGGILALLFHIVVKETHLVSNEIAKEIVQDLFRDVGIAFIIAIVVTLTYEMYARSLYDYDNLGSILNTVMKSFVHADIWDEVRDQVIGKTMIRENAHITLRLEEDRELCAQGQMIICIEFNYDLYTIRATSQKDVELRHYLDDHVRHPEKNLPRFDLVIVGSNRYDNKTALDKRTKKGVFVDKVDLEPRNAHPVYVRTQRREITYVPGSYYLVMNELTRKIDLDLQPLPDGVVADLGLWPHFSSNVPLEPGNTWHFDQHILLPGQGLEFRFKRDDLPTRQSSGLSTIWRSLQRITSDLFG